MKTTQEKTVASACLDITLQVMVSALNVGIGIGTRVYVKACFVPTMEVMKIAMVMVIVRTPKVNHYVIVTRDLQMMVLISAGDVQIHFLIIQTSARPCRDSTLLFKIIMSAARCLTRCLTNSMTIKLL